MDADLHVLDETVDPSEWGRAGDDFVGESAPTTTLGQFGVESERFRIGYWARRDRASFFAVGAPFQEDPSPLDDGTVGPAQTDTDDPLEPASDPDDGTLGPAQTDSGDPLDPPPDDLSLALCGNISLFKLLFLTGGLVSMRGMFCRHIPRSR